MDAEKVRTCTKCREEKPLRDFPRRGNGYRYECKRCYCARLNAWKQARKPEERWCRRCQQYLPQSEFDTYQQASHLGERFPNYYTFCRGCRDKPRPNNHKQNVKRHQERHRYDAAWQVSTRVRQTKHKAKSRGVSFALTVDYMMQLYREQEGRCYYTGVQMDFGLSKPIRPTLMSIDRLTPSLGYVPGNVVWCCFRTNVMKQNFSEAEFYSAMNTILQHRGERQPTP